MDDKPLKVRLLDPALRRSYGPTTHYQRERAIRGQNAGKWIIIEDPLNPNLAARSKETETSKKRAKACKKGYISIIIIALNNLIYTMACVESIIENTGPEHQIILVDNGSKDNTSAWFMRIAKENYILLRNQKNIGFSKANNQALKLARGEYVLFLNNDSKINQRGWEMPFFEGLSEADIVGPTMRKLIIDPSDSTFIYAGDGQALDPFHYLEGWCLFGKKQTFNALGGMDEIFTPAYSEDSDLSFKAIQAGFRIKKIKDVPIVHFGQKTSSQMGEMFGVSVRNRRKLYKKWVSRTHANILVKRRGAIGDVLMTTPILRELKKLYTESKIFVETQCPQLIEGNPNIHQIISVSEETNFDLIYELEYEAFPGEVRIDAMARQAGVKLDSRRMETHLREPNKIPIKKPYVVFHTGKSWPNRELSIDKWTRVAEYLAGQGFSVAEVGTSATERIPFDGIADFRNRQWGFVSKLIRNADFFVGIDSACSNLAKAVGTPAFIFYGCVNPEVMLADAIEYPIVAKEIECQGCRDRSNAHYVECDKPEILCCTKVYAENFTVLIDRYLKNTRRKVVP